MVTPVLLTTMELNNTSIDYASAKQL